EERGDPRGELLRLQCALSSLSEEDRRRNALECRERELLQRHQRNWLGSLLVGGRCRFQRGLIHIRARLEELEGLMSALQEPGEGAAGREALEVYPYWAPDWELAYPRYYAPARKDRKRRITALFACPALAHLVSLSLPQNDIGYKGAATLA